MSRIVISPFMRFQNHTGYKLPFDSPNQRLKVSEYPLHLSRH